MKNELGRSKRTKWRLKGVRIKGVRLSRGGGFVSVCIVREREARGGEERKYEKAEKQEGV